MSDFIGDKDITITIKAIELRNIITIMEGKIKHLRDEISYYREFKNQYIQYIEGLNNIVESLEKQLQDFLELNK